MTSSKGPYILEMKMTHGTESCEMKLSVPEDAVAVFDGLGTMGAIEEAVAEIATRMRMEIDGREEAAAS